MSTSWPKYISPRLPCSCTDLLSLTGPHSPHANTQLNTDKATLLDLSQLLSLAKCVNRSLSVPHFLSLSVTPLYLPFGPASMAPYCRFISLPFLPIPSVTLPPLHHGKEEDGPSCCARVLPLWSNCVCVGLCACMWAWKREREGASENHHYRPGVLPSVLITVNFFLSLSLCEPVAFWHTHPCPHATLIYTKTSATGQHDITEMTFCKCENE